MSDASAHTLPFVLGVVGDSGSGKSTVAAGVRALIGPERVTSVELDDYHRYSRAERQERGLTALNPLVHNLAIVQEHLQLLRAGRPIRNRSYDHTDGSFGPIRVIEPREVVIARGLLGFPSDELREAYDLAVFLHPEPELLFRWKLRRDVSTRGYTEAEVLKYIAKHLLDSKEYVVPQSERADLVVRYEIAAWEAPDSEVQISVILRRRAADALRHGQPFVRFGDSVRLEDRDGELVLHLTSDLTAGVVDAWAGELFPDTYDAEAVGSYTDQDGGAAHGASIAFAEVLIAHLTQRLRRTEELAVDRFDGAAHVEGMAG